MCRGVNEVRRGAGKSRFGKVGMRIWMKYVLVAMGVICFPWLVTLMFTGEFKGKVYKATNSEYYVIDKKSRIGLEDFVACALVKQMDIGEKEEALKAQAVIVRTYIYEKMSEEKVKEINVKKLDIPYISYEEMEKIWGDDFSDNYNKLMKVVEDTSAQVLMYKGEAIKPYFHNTSCGYTRDGVSTFGEGYEYLVSVQSVGDVDSENYQSSVSFTKEEFVKLLRKNKQSIALSIENPLETMQVIKRDNGGYVEELQIGNVTMSGDEFAHIFSLKSPNFQVEESEGKIHIVTKGIGHGIGLSVYGSILLAKEGKNYTEILQHYYSEVYLEPLWEE